jgi:hypothetical protein
LDSLIAVLRSSNSFNIVVYRAQQSLIGLKDAMRAKSRHHVLMHPTKRRVLLRLLAARAFLGGDDVARYEQLPLVTGILHSRSLACETLVIGMTQRWRRRSRTRGGTRRAVSGRRR